MKISNQMDTYGEGDNAVRRGRGVMEAAASFSSARNGGGVKIRSKTCETENDQLGIVSESGTGGLGGS